MHRQATRDSTYSFSTGHLVKGLRGRSLRGGGIAVIAQAVKFTLHLCATVVLARLLTPTDFGMVAMVTALTGFVGKFADAGLSMATVQRHEVTQAQVSTLFWVNFALGGLLMLLVSALAPAVAWFYGNPELTYITLALASVFLLASLSVQHNAILMRQMRFVALAGKDVAAMAAGVTAGLVLAIGGAGYWALVAMPAASTLVGMLLAWVLTGWSPSRPRRNADVRSMLAFGGNLAGFNLINYFARNADNVLIGWYWGAASLGLYSKAYSLMKLPITQLTGPLQSIAIPALSRIRDQPERYAKYYTTLVNLMMWGVGPLVAALAAAAPMLIQVLLGEEWLSAVPIFQILALTSVFQPLYSSTGMIFTSWGRTDRMLRFGMISTPLFVASFVVGLPYGAIGVAGSYTVVFLLALPFLLAFTYHGTPVRPSAVGKAIIWPLCASAVTFIMASVGARMLPPSLPLLSLLCSAALAILGAPLLMLVPPIRQEARAIINNLKSFR